MDVPLRPIAITDLSLTYARNHGNRVITHYWLPYQLFLVDPEVTPVEHLRSYFKTVLGEDIEVLPPTNADQGCDDVVPTAATPEVLDSGVIKPSDLC